jgi:hypothetical protein
MRSKTTRLGALVGAAALLGGVALSASGLGVGLAQTGSPTASPAPTVAVTPAGPTPASNVGGPSAVPSARFFGSVSGGSLAPGASVTASIGGVACGFGTVNGGFYTVDIQAIQGCTAPGASVSFTVGGQPAGPAGTLPAIPGTAVMNNLTVTQATPAPTAPPPPPPPTRAATPPPPPTVRPTTPAATARPASPTPAPRPSATAAQGARPAAPAAQKPAAPAAQRPAGPVALPRTGTGGLGEQGGATSVALLSIILGALALSATGLVAYRRSR